VGTDSQTLKATEPFSLQFDRRNEIWEHGDSWRAKIDRLHRFGQLPDSVLFAVRQPGAGTLERKAADEVCTELTQYPGVDVLDVGETAAIGEWARV